MLLRAERGLETDTSHSYGTMPARQSAAPSGLQDSTRLNLAIIRALVLACCRCLPLLACQALRRLEAAVRHVRPGVAAGLTALQPLWAESKFLMAVGKPEREIT
jgi:hypothetical protein